VLAYAPRLARLAWRIAAGDRDRAAPAHHGYSAAGGHGHAAPGGHEHAVMAGNDHGSAVVEGASTRWLLLAAALAIGLILAALTIHLTGAWQGGGPAS